MQHKISNHDVKKNSFPAPELNQDVMNNIASHVSYAHGLAALRQTSVMMDNLVEKTASGQLHRRFKRDPDHYRKNYEDFFVTPISFLSIPLVFIPISIGVTVGVAGCIACPLGIGFLNEAISFRASCDLIAKSIRFFGRAPQKTQNMLLADTNRKRRNIQDQQEIMCDKLREPVQDIFAGKVISV